jgi:PAS domain S-box-containing protein
MEDSEKQTKAVSAGITSLIERKQAEQELRRVNRALRTISSCNQAIVRATEELHLLEDLCGIIVREGGYRMAWVGFAEHDEVRSVRPVAHAGFEEGYLQTVSITWADTDRGRGPTGTAIRTGRPVVARDIQADPSFAPWREDAGTRGYASSIALPLLLNDQVLGALIIYAEGADTFDSVEMQLLTGLSNDLAYGIQALRTRAERQRAEKELRLAQFSVEHASDAVYWLNSQGGIVYANEAACRSLGRSRKELLSLTISDVHPLSSREAWESFWEEVKVRGSMAFETEHQTKRGRVFPVEVTANYLEFDGKEYTFAFARDITERKQAEQTLALAEEKYRSLVLNIPDVAWTVDSMGHLTFVSPNIEKLSGFSATEIVQGGVRLFREGDHLDARRVRASLEALFSRGEAYDVEYRVQRKSGEWISVHDRAVATYERNGVRYADGLLSDITERRRAEEERQRSVEQLRALAARLQSIREEERKSVAREIHDQLGQALTAIKVDLSSLVRELPAGEEQQSKRTASILKLVDEAIQSVRRISTELRPGMLDDLGLVATVAWAGEDFEARTGTRCRLDLPQDDIAVDPEQATAIFRIFQEALTNVARHADASEVNVRLAKEGSDLTLEVHDNGKGIAGGKLSTFGSLGILGMRERAMLLGGELTISGPPGNGTTVRVRIPEARQNHQEQLK